MANVQSESLVFEEVDGRKRKITLAGNEAPHGQFRGEAAFEEGGEVRRSLKWEPGAMPPAPHITGTKENDLVVRGHLRDSLTGNNGFGTPAVAPLFEGRARKIKEAIEAIRVSARQLRIVWQGGQAGGLLAKTRFMYEAEGEYQYELTFDVYWRGAPPKPRKRRPLAASATSRVADLDALVGNAKASLVKVPGISLALGTMIDDYFAAVASPLGALMSLAANLESSVADFVNGRALLVARAEALWRRLTELLGFLHSVPAPDDAADAAAWRRAHAAALNLLYDAAEKTYELGVEAETKAAGITNGVYVAKDGDSLDSIAMRLGVSLPRLRAANLTLPLGRIPAGTRARIPGA